MGFRLSKESASGVWFLQIALNREASTSLSWIASKSITLATEFTDPVNWPSSPETWLFGQYLFKTTSLFTRFYPLTEIREAAKVLEGFFRKHSGQCRYGLGSLKGQERWPLVTVECNTIETAQLLKKFVQYNADMLRPDRPGSGYIDLPLDGSDKYRQAYFSQHAELSAIKRIWDPTDFFS